MIKMINQAFIMELFNSQFDLNQFR